MWRWICVLFAWYYAPFSVSLESLSSRLSLELAIVANGRFLHVLCYIFCGKVPTFTRACVLLLARKVTYNTKYYRLHDSHSIEIRGNSARAFVSWERSHFVQFYVAAAQCIRSLPSAVRNIASYVHTIPSSEPTTPTQPPTFVVNNSSLPSSRAPSCTRCNSNPSSESRGAEYIDSHKTCTVSHHTLPCGFFFYCETLAQHLNGIFRGVFVFGFAYCLCDYIKLAYNSLRMFCGMCFFSSISFFGAAVCFVLFVRA